MKIVVVLAACSLGLDFLGRGKQAIELRWITPDSSMKSGPLQRNSPSAVPFDIDRGMIVDEIEKDERASRLR